MHARSVRDLPIAGHPVLLVWAKRVCRCMEALCPTVTWSETSPAIRAKAVLTERARARACRRVGRAPISVAQVALTLGGVEGTTQSPVDGSGRTGAAVRICPPRRTWVHSHGFCGGPPARVQV